MNTEIETTTAAASQLELKQIAPMWCGAPCRRRHRRRGVVSEGTEFSTVVRLGEVETLKESGSRGARRTRLLSASARPTPAPAIFRPRACEQLVDSAPRAGKDHHRRSLRRHCPRPSELGQLNGDLDLYYEDVYSLSNADRIDYARRAEKAALDCRSAA